MTLGWREFRLQLTPKDDKDVYNQNVPNEIHLKENLIIKLALGHEYRITRVLY